LQENDNGLVFFFKRGKKKTWSTYIPYEKGEGVLLFFKKKKRERISQPTPTESEGRRKVSIRFEPEKSSLEGKECKV